MTMFLSQIRNPKIALAIKISLLVLCVIIISLIIYFFASAESHKSSSENSKYCNKTLCPKKGPHIGCNNDDKIASLCAKTSNVVKMTPELKQLILETHNSHRNEIAGAKIQGYEPATRMASMTWHQELAYLAELNVKTCKFEHDKCRNTKEFRNSGQNLYTYSSYPAIKANETIKRAIDDWFHEYNQTTMDIIRNYQSNTNPKVKYGHFTVMVIDKNFKVGCGCLKIIEDEGEFQAARYLFACNYATTNFIGKPIYKSGESASECKMGKNPIYTNLCSLEEHYELFKPNP